MAFLRVYLAWEVFLEDTFHRYLCGYWTLGCIPPLRYPPEPTLDVADAAVRGTRDYISWADPQSVIRQSRRFFTSGPHEVVLNSAIARIQAFNAIRNRIVHRSSYSKTVFSLATVTINGKRYLRPGQFLRDTNPATARATRWLATLTGELKGLAAQVTP